MHVLLPGPPPDAAEVAAQMRQFIRASPEWAELVRIHGPEQAERLLSQIKAQVSRFPPEECGNL
jgi:hypothetical protein